MSVGKTNKRVEVYHKGIWGTVCDDSFGLLDAIVACRQLGMGAAVTYGTVGGGKGAIHFEDMACNGTQGHLSSCKKSMTKHNCGHNEDVGVTCKVPTTKAPTTWGCAACPAGKTDHDRDASTACEACAAGRYSAKASAVGACAACAAGSEPRAGE